jgi:hypothetical protein
MPSAGGCAESLNSRRISCYADQVQAMQVRGAEAPRELEELVARMERLRERLSNGDVDMTLDEIQAAIDRAEGKRRALSEEAGVAIPSAKMFALLPWAAELYREQIALGLDGDPQAALRASTFLSEWFSGEIRLVPGPDGGLVARWKLDRGALLRAVVIDGSGGRICHVPRACPRGSERAGEVGSGPCLGCRVRYHDRPDRYGDSYAGGDCRSAIELADKSHNSISRADTGRWRGCPANGQCA